jgi:hypothetical protein
MRCPARDRQREERGIISIEGEPVVGLVLKDPAAEQEENQAGERIEVAFAAARRDVPDALQEQGGDAGGNRDITNFASSPRR